MADINGTTGDDTLFGFLYETNSIVGGKGNDTITGGTLDDIIRGRAGNDVIDGGKGNDFITGDAGNDKITGGKGDDRVDGGDGDDIIYGRDGDDIIVGGSGNDQLIGDAGNDRLYGGIGDDKLAGGVGADTFVFNSSDGKDTITDFSHVAGDKIEFDRTGLTYADLVFTDSSNGLIVSYGSHGDTILLKGIHTVESSDFIFHG